MANIGNGEGVNELEILPRRDLIIDEYGNYYTAVTVKSNEIVLVNAFMKLSFQRLLKLENISKEYTEYDGQYFGKIAMDMLKNKIENLKTNKIPGNIYRIEDIREEYKINFIPLYESSPTIKVNQL